MSHDQPEWEAVIGLEIHLELNTKSKLFSSAPNRFGGEPNSNISEMCTGMPGALPVLNREAVHKAVQFGCAINAEVAKFSTFDRKSYFYPDSPRNFQITQYEQPILIGGTIIAEVDGHERSFDVEHVHLEDDAGMLKHFSGYAGIDYNRAGVPLIEIVSEPCMHTAKEASAYARAIKTIAEYLDISDCNMEEGSLRIDCNVSVRRKGETALRERSEIKNINSFTFMELAIESEMSRQIREYKENPGVKLIPATYRWDAERKETVMMRRKESSDDYRYFPEPDLVPIVLTTSFINQVREALPELPLERKKRYKEELGLTEPMALQISAEKAVADYFEEGLSACTNARALANWILVEFPGRLKDSAVEIEESGIKVAHIGNLVTMIDEGTITGKIAKKVANDMIAQPGRDPADIVASTADYQPLTDGNELEGIIDEVIAANPQSVADLQGGKKRALGYLVGQVMQATRGKANPQAVNETICLKIKFTE